MARIRFAREARADLKNIGAYIAADNPAAAARFAERILQRCALLAERPALGRPRPELSQDLRSSPIERYIIFYWYWPSEDGIVVARVLHSARDVTRQFGG